MDNPDPNLPEPGFEPEPEPQTEAGLNEEKQPNIYIERIKHAFNRAKSSFKDAREYYSRSPRLQKVSYQGKYLPAFWTVACLFSLGVNILLIALLTSFGRNFFELKALIADGLINETSNSLALMDDAHIVKSVPVEVTVRLQDNLPVQFDLPINQKTQLSLAQASRISGAYIYLNNTAVQTDLTLPAGTLIQANFDMTVPVSTTVPVDITAPVSGQVPVDIPVDQTDLHQSIVGLQGAIEPYKFVMGSAFNSPRDFPTCNQWWSGWLCTIFFGKQ